MGSQPENDPSFTPKLSLFSLPNKRHESPGMITPPCGSKAAVPFQWEEAPGKPRRCATTEFKPNSARTLELPPRLLCEGKAANLPSPTTVLDGPYVGSSVSHRFYFSSSDGGGLEKRVARERGLLSTSLRWGSFRKSKVALDGSFDSSSSVVDDGGGGDTTVKITRVRRRRSLLNLSHTRSQLLASIYESLKQVVPWRRRQERLERTDA